MKLRDLQRAMAADVMASGSLKTGNASYIRPNDRLTSRERLDIYRSQYRHRLIDSLHDDFPGLRVVLGTRAFARVASAYIDDCPSESHTLRDLGREMEVWLTAHPEMTGVQHELALDMARLEWAHIESFDAADVKPLGPEDLAGVNPKMKLGLQPHVRLLAVRHPIDDIRIRRKRLRGGEKIYLATHRVDGDVFYRRLEEGEFELLTRISAGHTVAVILKNATGYRQHVQRWFAVWAELGWLTSSPSAVTGQLKRPTKSSSASER